MQKKMGVFEADEKKKEYNQRPRNRLGVDSLKMIKAIVAGARSERKCL